MGVGPLTSRGARPAAGRAPLSARPSPDGAGAQRGGSAAGFPAEPPPALRHPGRAAAGLRAPAGDRVALAAAGRGSGAAAAGGPGGAAPGGSGQRLPHLRALRAGAPAVAPGPRDGGRPRARPPRPPAPEPRRRPSEPGAEQPRRAGGAAAAGQESRRRGRWEPEAEGAAGKGGSLQGAPEAAEPSRGAAETHYHPRSGLRDAEANEGAGEGEGLPAAGAGAGRRGPELVPPAAPSPAGAPEAAGTKQRSPGRGKPGAAQPSLPPSAGAEPVPLAAALPLCQTWELKPPRLAQPACHSAGPLPICRATTDHPHAERTEQAPHQGGDGQRPPDHPAGAGEVGPHQAALWSPGRKYQGQQPAGFHLHLASGHQLPLSGASSPPPRDWGNETSPMGGAAEEPGPYPPALFASRPFRTPRPAGGVTVPSLGKDILNGRLAGSGMGLRLPLSCPKEAPSLTATLLDVQKMCSGPVRPPGVPILTS